MVYTLGVGTDEPAADTGITGDLAMYDVVMDMLGVIVVLSRG